jgi:arsenate reductase
MAEGLLKTLYGDYYVSSAGITPTHISPCAIEVMKEYGIDLSTHRSKSVDECKDKTFDYVVTVCDYVKEACPFFPGKKVIHKGFPDPSTVDGNLEEITMAFRKIRDEIKSWIEQKFQPK